MIQTFNELSLDELCHKLSEDKKTLILYHVRPDADAVGSAFALREILRCLGVYSYCVCDDELPERLAFLADGAQGSVLLEDDMKIGYERAISVDSASPSQLGDVFLRIHKDIDIMIDHHASGSKYADYYVDAGASATGEIIYRIADRMCQLGMLDEIPERVKNCVYAAISSDTGGFRFANASPAALRIAAELIEDGVDSAEINRLLFDSKSIKQIKGEGEAISELCVHEGGRIASTIMTYATRKRLGLSDEDLGTLIDIPRSVYGAEIAFAIREEADGSCRVSMRSATDFDVAAVCAAFGGGGHKRAAGCTIKGMSAEDAEEMLVAEICKRF